jgi:hypothetical protein
MRIDEPYPARARAGRDGAFLAAELRRDQCLEHDLKALFDFAIERTAAARTARALRRVKFGAQLLALRLDGGDHAAKRIGGRHAVSVELFFF